MECVEVTESEIPIVSPCEEESEGIALTEEESQASDLLELPETTDVEECGTSQTASLLSNDADTSTEMQKEGPHQPLLRSYDQKMYQNESRDFNPQLFKKYPWTSFNITSKCIECYACQKYSANTSFQYCNWKKPERLQKHAKSKIHTLSMTKWLSHQISQRRNNSILMQLNNSHQITVKKNRDYLRVVIETLVFTAQQNIAQRGVDEN